MAQCNLVQGIASNFKAGRHEQIEYDTGVQVILNYLNSDRNEE